MYLINVILYTILKDINFLRTSLLILHIKLIFNHFSDNFNIVNFNSHWK
jgi:hypothetical protein